MQQKLIARRFLVSFYTRVLSAASHDKNAWVVMAESMAHLAQARTAPAMRARKREKSVLFFF